MYIYGGIITIARCSLKFLSKKDIPLIDHERLIGL